MTDSPRSEHGTLPLSVARALDRLCDRFERAWQAAAAGTVRPRLEDYAAEVAAEYRLYLLHKLIPLEVEYRRRHGEDPQAQEYLARFPELDPAWLASRLTGPPANGQEPAPPTPASEAEAARTPRVRCPHCHNPIQLADSGSEEVLCPGCGSAFRVRDARQTTTSSAMRPLGQFQLLERVGVGAFGAVWRARDTVLDRIIALKIPHTGLLTSEVELERFHREARAAAQLRHPGIVTVHEVQMLEGLPVIIADFVNGVPLRDLLQVRPLTFREAAALLAEVAEAVDYAHSMGLVHRDLKPANIMMEYPRSTLEAEEDGAADGLGRPLVMDFGLALRSEAEVTMTQDGHILGTPAYMSPEQAAGKSHQADRRSDVYSLGVILYELLTGELPFRGNARLIIHQVLHAEPRPPRKINDKIPRDLETICLKAMDKSPARRYFTARALAEDLRRHLKGEPILARRVSRLERFGRWCGRNPVVAGLAAVVFLILIVGTAISTFFAFQAQDQAQQAREQARQARANAIQMQAERDHADQESRLARANEFRVRQHSYVAQINLAQRAWEDGHIRRVRELLEAQKPEHTGGHDFRGFEWHLLNRLCHTEILSLADQNRPWLDVVFSPDGTRLAAVSGDPTSAYAGGGGGALTVWDTATGQVVFSLGKSSAKVKGVSFSPDSKRLRIVGEEGQLTTWDLVTGKRIQNLPGHGRKVGAAAFSRDGKFLATAIGTVHPLSDHLQVWDTTTGKLAWEFSTSGVVTCLAFSPDGRRLARGLFVNSFQGAELLGSLLQQQVIKVWDIATGKQLCTANQDGGVLSLAFSPDGKWLASGGRDKTVRVWEAATGREVRSLFGHGFTVASVRFSPDGRWIASGGWDNLVKVWDAQTGKDVYTFRGHTDPVGGVAFSPDGKRLASASGDKTVKVWDVTQDPEAIIYREPIVPVDMRLAFHPDGKRVALARVTSGTQVRIWDLITRKMNTALEANFLAMRPITSIAFSPDGKRLALLDVNWLVKRGKNEVRIWDVSSGKATLTLEGNSPALASTLVFSPDSQRLVAAGGYDKGSIWDLVSMKSIGTVQGFSVAFDRNGRCLAASDKDEMITVRDQGTGQEVRKVPGRGGFLSPDGRRLAATDLNGRITIWNLSTGEQLSTFETAAGAGHVAFSPDGRRLASIDQNSNVQVWDTDTGNELIRFKGANYQLMALAFSPDGYRLGVVGTEGRSCFVKIWDGMPLEEKPAKR